MRWKFAQLVVGLSVLLYIGAAPAAASDGQVLCNGSNIFSNVYVLNGRATTDTCPVHDCPTYVTDCHLEYRWLTKCEWLWCTTFDDRSGWVRGDTATRLSWCENGKQEYKLEYRTTWTSQATKIMKAYASNESILEIGLSTVIRLVTRGWFNYTNQTGYQTGTNIKTITGVMGNTDPVVVATSGSWITLSC